MFEYICVDCERIEYAIDIELKKRCHDCGYYMECREPVQE